MDEESMIVTRQRMEELYAQLEAIVAELNAITGENTARSTLRALRRMAAHDKGASAVTDDMPAYTVALAKFQAAREELDRLMPASVRAKLQASRQQAPELVAATFRCKKCGSEWTAPVLSDEIDGACPECDPPEHKPQ